MKTTNLKDSAAASCILHKVQTNLYVTMKAPPPPTAASTTDCSCHERTANCRPCK